jgi:xanthine dehydrogenase YagS FAD-binding subunit
VVLGPPATGERAAYFRTISRARAEWPLVEALVRLVVDGGTIVLARVAIGGVANRPLRLPKVEAVLEGARVDDALLAKAAKTATEGSAALPMTAYKVDLVEGTVLETLERALSDAPEKPGSETPGSETEDR